ncbi:MAG: hypothetical protein NVSMB8_02990 [Candidatus Limnocylindrales bacterium]
MLPRPEPREAFRRELRGRLMAEARVALAPRPTTKETAWVALQRLWLRPAFVFAAIAIFLVGGSGLAAAGSLPGDPAFALKRAAEDVQLALAPDENARIEVLATQADHRLAELSAATTERPTVAPTASAAYADAVAKLNVAIGALRGKPDPGATKADAAREVAERARAKHIVVLDELEGRVPEEARDSIEQAKHEADKIGPTEDRGPGKGPGAAPTRTPSHSAAGTARPAASDDHDNDEDARTPAPAPTARPTETRRPATASPSASIRR